MSSSVIYFLALLISVSGAGELLVQHVPQSVSFVGKKPLDARSLRDVFTVALGFTPSRGSSWDGLVITDPFHFAEAVVTVLWDGAPAPDVKASRIPLKGGVDDEELWLDVSRRVMERDSDGTSKLLRLNLAEGKSEALESILGPLESSNLPPALSELNTNITEDREFVDQLMLLREITRKVTDMSADGAPDVFMFGLTALRPVLDLHGRGSPAAEEAEELAAAAVRALAKAFIHAYNKQVVFATLVSSGNDFVRKTRSLMADEAATATEDSLNLSKDYDENYPVIFNILFWFNIAFFYAVIAVAVFIADMDPGRDSIIYRMTSNRMKKDN